MLQIILLSLILIVPGIVLAHQPHVVDFETDIFVENPEISKAYYGELIGAPARYYFETKDDFDLYVNILVPNIKGATDDYSVNIFRNENLVADLVPHDIKWTVFNEPYGGDVYRMGMEYRSRGLAGRYEIIVSSPDNRGKYVLAVGEIESFPPGEILRTMVELVQVKHFFGKSKWMVFQSRFIYGPTIVLLLIGGVAALIVRRKRKIRVC